VAVKWRLSELEGKEVMWEKEEKVHGNTSVLTSLFSSHRVSEQIKRGGGKEWEEKSEYVDDETHRNRESRGNTNRPGLKRLTVKKKKKREGRKERDNKGGRKGKKGGPLRIIEGRSERKGRKGEERRKRNRGRKKGKNVKSSRLKSD